MSLRQILSTTNLAHNEALPTPLSSRILRSLRFSPFAFFPMLASEKNLSESSRRVSNSGHRSISTAPYLTASVNRFGLRPANPFITHETTLTSGDGGCCISWQIYG